MRRLLSAALALGAIVFITSSALANNVIVNIVGTDGTTVWRDSVAIPIDPDGTFFGTGQSNSAAWSLDYLVTGDADPIVTANFSAANLLSTSIGITVTTTLPVSPALGGPTLTSGSVGYTVTDGSLPSNGATVSTQTGASMYQAYIDGLTAGDLFMTLLDDPTTLTAAAGGSATTSASFGLPGQTTVGPGVSTDMSIVYQFDLSARDLVGITGNFVVIPEPTSLALAGLSLVALVAKARRRVR